MRIAFATSNEHKFREVRKILGYDLQRIELTIPEMQEINIEEVLKHKAKTAFDKHGQPVLVEDTGLIFHAWNGLPGALISWFLKTVGNEGLCTMLNGYYDRSATAVSCIGYYDGKENRIFQGRTLGSIAEHPRGNTGFGWDAIFIPNGAELTFAQLQPDQYTPNTMRHQAILKLQTYLKSSKRWGM